MSDKEIWIVSTKSRPLEGCAVDFDGSEFYFVECLIPASSKEEAIAPIEHALRDELFDLEKTISVSPYVSSEWENEVQFREVDEAAEKAKSTGQLQFGLFISSGVSEDDDYDGEDEVEWS